MVRSVRLNQWLQLAFFVLISEYDLSKELKQQWLIKLLLYYYIIVSFYHNGSHVWLLVSIITKLINKINLLEKEIVVPTHFSVPKIDEDIQK